jgi:hypothetical protein
MDGLSLAIIDKLTINRAVILPAKQKKGNKFKNEPKKGVFC